MNPNFDQPNLAGIILPQSCKYIDGYAFAGAGNMKFTDLGGAIYIGDSAFNDNACVQHLRRHLLRKRMIFWQFITEIMILS